MLRASVIIPVYRHWDLLKVCLNALGKQTLSQDAFEVILVNNDPAVPPPADFDLPANARVIDEVQKGSYAARNAGVKVAVAPVLCFTDADCQPAPGWLEAALEALDTMAAPARSGGPVDLMFGDGPLGWAEVYQKMTAFDQRKNIQSGGWSVTANMCTHKSAFERVGPFDTQSFSGGDRAWGERALGAGIPIAFCEEQRVGHPARVAMADLIRKERRLTGGKVQRSLRRKGRALVLLGFILTLPLKLLPLSSKIRRLLLMQGLPIRDRVRAASTYHLLKVIRVIETGRLLMGGAPERR